MVKENLLKFDGTPLFPERIAYTVPYKLSEPRGELYKAVTDYVREEFNRAEALAEGEGRRGNASASRSPSCSAGSPPRPRRSTSRCAAAASGWRTRLARRRRSRGRDQLARRSALRELDDEDVEDLEDAADDEVEEPRRRSSTRRPRRGPIAELEAEIDTLAPARRRWPRGSAAAATDSKWERARRRSLQTSTEMFDADRAAPEARRLHRAPRHAELPRGADQHAARPRGGRRRHPRRHAAARSGGAAQERSSTTPTCGCCSPPTPPARASTSSAPT